MKSKELPRIPPDFKAVDKTYSLYGKTVRSNYRMPLPEVNAQKPDITITFRGLVPKPEALPADTKNRVWEKEKESSILRYFYSSGHMHEFRISHDGTAITFIQSWPEWRDTLFPLMNAVMAAAISLQGGTTLHGSSLVYNNRSALITGISGAGKSTLSAALAVQGMSLHSDDIAAVEWTNDKIPTVMAGYPMIKINPVLKEILGLTEFQLTPIIVETNREVPYQQKTAKADVPEKEKWLSADYLTGGFYSGPAALHTIIILEERIQKIDEPLVKQLSPMNAAMALTEHIYARDWLNKPGPDTLTFCTALAKKMPVYKINMPDNRDLINRSASHIRKEIIEAKDG